MSESEKQDKVNLERVCMAVKPSPAPEKELLKIAWEDGNLCGRRKGFKFAIMMARNLDYISYDNARKLRKAVSFE